MQLFFLTGCHYLPSIDSLYTNGQALSLYHHIQPFLSHLHPKDGFRVRIRNCWNCYSAAANSTKKHNNQISVNYCGSSSISNQFWLNVHRTINYNHFYITTSLFKYNKWVLPKLRKDVLRIIIIRQLERGTRNTKIPQNRGGSQKHNHLPTIIINGIDSNNNDKKCVLWQKWYNQTKRGWKHNKNQKFADQQESNKKSTQIEGMVTETSQWATNK